MWHFLLFRQPLLLEYSTSADSRNINLLLKHSNQQIALFLSTNDPVFSAWALCPISLKPTERYFFTTNTLPFFHNLHIAHFSFNQLLIFFTTDRLPIIFQPIDRSFSTTDTSFFFHNLHITFFFQPTHRPSVYRTFLTSLAFRPFIGVLFIALLL
jgi:hypothetical protein